MRRSTQAEDLVLAEEQIRFAEAHIRNAKAWIRNAKRKKPKDMDYHASEALDEAASALEGVSALIAQID